MDNQNHPGLGSIDTTQHPYSVSPHAQPDVTAASPIAREGPTEEMIPEMGYDDGNKEWESKGPEEYSGKQAPQKYGSFGDSKKEGADGFQTRYQEGREEGDSSDEASSMELSMPNVQDPFPEDLTLPPEDTEFTFRSLLVGCVLGALINASNLYLGLKTGLSFGAGLFGAIGGFGIIKILQKILPTVDRPSSSQLPGETSVLKRFFKMGDYFGPKENCLIVSTATSAGSMGAIYATAFPAFYQLQLLSPSVHNDIGRLITFGLVSCYFGMVFAIPLRKLYILRLKLPFPQDAATAFLVKSLHASKEAAMNLKKVKWLLWAFLISLIWRVTSEYAPGIMWDWHVFWWMYSPGGWKWIVNAENWGWYFEWSPAFIGLGMLIGLNGSGSFLGGAAIAWGLIGPLTVSSGVAIGIELAPTLYPGYIDYWEMQTDDPINNPSPRYWMVWPGIMILLCGTAMEVAVQGKAIGKSFSAAVQPAIKMVKQRRFISASDQHAYDEAAKHDPDVIYDPMPVSERVPSWMWGSVLFLSILGTILVLGIQFKENVGVTILALVCAFVFTFASADPYARISINPTIGGTASQLVLAGVSKGQHHSINSGARSSLIGATLGVSASQQACDMLGNLKTSHLLGASPRIQFYGQFVGGLISVFLSVGLYVLFTDAFPCINDSALAAQCQFSLPSTVSAIAITQAVLSPKLPIPPSSGYTAIAFGIVSALVVLAKHLWVPERYKKYVPNLTAFGIGFVLPGTYIPMAIFLGSLISTVWQWKWARTYIIFAYPIAVGMISGEGIGGVINAIIQIAGGGGSKYGTGKGCPAASWCG